MSATKVLPAWRNDELSDAEIAWFWTPRPVGLKASYQVQDTHAN